jgi:hypothetical protein
VVALELPVFLFICSHENIVEEAIVDCSSQALYAVYMPKKADSRPTTSTRKVDREQPSTSAFSRGETNNKSQKREDNGFFSFLMGKWVLPKNT